MQIWPTKLRSHQPQIQAYMDTLPLMKSSSEIPKECGLGDSIPVSGWFACLTAIHSCLQDWYLWLISYDGDLRICA